MKPTLAKLVDKKWLITGEPHILLKLKGVFPKIAKGEFGEVTLKHTTDTAKDLEWFAMRYPVTFDPLDVLEKQARIYDKRQSELKRLLDPNFKPEPCVLAFPLRAYQEIAVAQLFSQGALLLSDDLGLGKTACALGAFSKSSPAIVVCQTHVATQWKAECLKFLPDSKPHIAQKVAPYELPSGTDILIITYSKLAGWGDHLSNGDWPVVVFDEVQDLRHSGTAKYNAGVAVAGAAQHRLALSATPIFNYGSEFFNVIELLKPGLLGSEHEFTREWCGWGKVVKDPVALGSFLRAEGVLLRRTKTDVGRELPKLQQLVYAVQSDRKAFDTAAGNAAELARILLDQGTAFEEKGKASRELDMRLRQATGIAKAPFVAEFVRLLAEEVGKVILTGWHRAVYDVWLEALKDLNPVMYTGTESPKQKDKAKEDFIKGNAKVFIMSNRSGAGLDGLQQVCSNIVIGELDWSPGVIDQLRGRIYRDGQTEPVNSYTLVSDDGSDPVIAQVLGVKKSQSVGTMDLGHGEIIESIPEGRIKDLARSYLKRHKG